MMASWGQQGWGRQLMSTRPTDIQTAYQSRSGRTQGEVTSYELAQCFPITGQSNIWSLEELKLFQAETTFWMWEPGCNFHWMHTDLKCHQAGWINQVDNVSDWDIHGPSCLCLCLLWTLKFETLFRRLILLVTKIIEYEIQLTPYSDPLKFFYKT